MAVNPCGAKTRAGGKCQAPAMAMAIRRRVLQRDGYACQCCGIVRADNDVDRRIPLEQGGSNDDSNLWLLCHECHAAKTAD